MPHVTVVCNQKGGVGKTTVSVNLAAATARVCPPLPPAEFDGQPLPTDPAELATALGKFQAQVLAVSTDPQGSMTDWLTMVEKTHAEAGKPMPIDYAQEHQNPRALAKLKTSRVYRGGIFVDSPGWLEGADGEAQRQAKQILSATLESADFVVVPIEPEDLAFRPTKRTIDQVLKPRGLPFLVVINNWDPRDGTGDLEDTKARIRRQGWPLAETVIRRYKLHTTAPASGRLITQYPSNRVAVEARSDFVSLALELAKHQGS